MSGFKLINLVLVLMIISSPSFQDCSLSQDEDQSMCRNILNTTHTLGLQLDIDDPVENNELAGFYVIIETFNPPIPNECVDFFVRLACISGLPPCGPDTGLPVLICEKHCTLYQKIKEEGLCEEIEHHIRRLDGVTMAATFQNLADVYFQFNCFDPATYFFINVTDSEPNSCTRIFSEDSERIFKSQLCDLGVSRTENCNTINESSLDSSILLKSLLPAAVIVLLAITIAPISLIFCINHKRRMLSERNVGNREVLHQELFNYQSNANGCEESIAQKSQANNLHSGLSEQYKNQFKELIIPFNSLAVGIAIGEGAFGEVFEGDLNGKKVAIKIIKNVSDSVLDSFLSEGVVMKGFSHPNVLGLVGVVFDTPDGTPHLVLPFMENGNLKNFLKSKREKSSGVDHLPEDLKLSDLLKMCIDVAQGMEYLADKMFVHRDLAARNCMVDKDWQVKVGDFGLSRDIYTTDYYRINDKSAKLPVKWLPPETFNDGISNEKTDIWAFGVTCWEVFSLGRTPYPTVPNSEIFTFLSHGGRLEKPALCPKEIYDMMVQCWEQRPEERPNFVEVAQILSEYWDDKYGYI